VALCGAPAPSDARQHPTYLPPYISGRQAADPTAIPAGYGARSAIQDRAPR